MKTIFNETSKRQLIERIQKITPNDKAEWGKMNSNQMLKHCILSEEMFQGKKKYKRLFVGKIFGKMALKGILKNELPIKKNQPTHPDFKIKGSGDFEAERSKWIALLEGYSHASNAPFIHPFFGKMSQEQIGQYVYKHTDHHLRQFNR